MNMDVYDYDEDYDEEMEDGVDHFEDNPDENEDSSEGEDNNNEELDIDVSETILPYYNEDEDDEEENQQIRSIVSARRFAIEPRPKRARRRVYNIESAKDHSNYDLVEPPAAITVTEVPIKDGNKVIDTAKWTTARNNSHQLRQNDYMHQRTEVRAEYRDAKTMGEIWNFFLHKLW